MRNENILTIIKMRKALDHLTNVVADRRNLGLTSETPLELR